MLTEKIQTDLKNAMKSGDAFRLSVLRMAQASIHNKSLEKRAQAVKAGSAPEEQELSDDEAVVVLRSEVKRRKDAALEFGKGNRAELAEKEMKEAGILQEYLPAEADDSAIEAAVAKSVEEAGKDPKMFGKVMGLAMKSLGSSASGDRVSAAVKKALGM